MMAALLSLGQQRRHAHHSASAEPRLRSITRRRSFKGVEEQPLDRFDWDKLNAHGRNASCGVTKCYFPSKLSEPEATGRRAGERVGYLVGWLPFWLGGTRKEYAKWLQTWTFSQELQTRFNVEHLLLGPPLLAPLPPEQATRLSAILAEDRVLAGIVNRTAGGRLYSAEPHSVQAVRSCPWPSCIILGCTKAKASKFQKSIAGFSAHAGNNTKVVQGLKRNLALVAAMVKAHRCLRYDFQVYLRNDGGVFNFDVDRCFDRVSPASQRDLARSSGLYCKTDSEQRLLDTALLDLYGRLSQ